MAEEATAQMEKYRAAGLPWMHLDSHHHSHTDLSIARIVLPIAKRFGFRSVRRSRNLGAGLTGLKRLYKRHINHYIGKWIPFNADYFCAFSDVVSSMASLRDACCVEVMTHPLYRDKFTGELSMSGTFMDHRTPIETMAEFWKRHSDKFQLIGLRQ